VRHFALALVTCCACAALAEGQAFPTPSGSGASLPSTSTVLKGNGSGGASATSITDNGTIISITEPLTASPNVLQRYSSVDTSSVFLGTVAGAAGNASMTGATQSVGVGLGALAATTSGTNNNAIGWRACWNVTTGQFNECMGHDGGSGFNGASSFNIAIGEAALYANGSPVVMNHNTAVGNAACTLITNSFNTCVGSYALGQALNTVNNAAVGQASGFTLTTGAFDTFLGQGADVAVGTLSNASAIGQGAIVNTPYTVALGGHFASHQLSTAATVTGTGCTLTYGNDNAGKITLSSGATVCTVTFGHAYSQPVVSLSASTASIVPILSSSSGAAFAITVASASGIVNYSVVDVE
jgi:hypothetical protein